ncbi:MAG: cytochrome C oxidase subunit IV, partial [Acidobacteria bacterium]
MSEHIVSPKVYIVIFVSLMLGTGITIWAAFQNFGKFNIVIALAIATIKASLV